LSSLEGASTEDAVTDEESKVRRIERQKQESGILEIKGQGEAVMHKYQRRDEMR
jgi:hypothetical protein